MIAALLTQARIGSTRLPSKVLMTISKKTLLSIHLENARKSELISNFIVATTNEPGVEMIEIEAINNGWQVYKGSLNDVLSRFYEATKNLNLNWIVRITSDCPFIQPHLIDAILSHAIANDIDYSCTSENFPDGVDVEVFKFEWLKRANIEANKSSEREHVTPWIKKNAIKQHVFEPETTKFKDTRLSVDEKVDFECVKYLIKEFGYDKPWITYSQFILDNTELFKNQAVTRNEGYLKSLKND